ncbi:MAG: PEP-CTERM system TPR-repeat protein PrsT [Rhodobacterales bacterium]|nr:PEP-CTERM system TPR-repeat protein PrsT [Rhodobacterales bacterium]
MAKVSETSETGGRTRPRRRRRAAALALAGSLFGALWLGAAGPALGQESLYEDALERFDKGEYDAAVIQLKNVLSDDPNNLSARILIGRAYLLMGAAASAEKELRRARDNGADDALTIVPLARAYAMQEKNDEILKDILPGGRANAVEAEIQYVRGLAFFNKHDLVKADKAFDAAMRMVPDFVLGLHGKAKVAIKRGEGARAEALVDRALKVEPDNADSWFLKGDLRQSLGDKEGALEAYNKAVEVHTGHLPSRTNRAAILMDMGRNEEAKADLDFVREIDRGDPQAAFLQAQVQARMGDENGARATLKEAEFILRNYEPGFIERHPPVMLIAAMIYFTQNNLDDAKSYGRAYMRVDPYHVGVRKLLGRVYLQEGNPSDAINVLAPAAQIRPDDPAVLTLLGTALMRDGNFNRAIEIFTKAKSLSANKALLDHQIGLARLGAGKREDAIQDLRRSLAENPQMPEASVVLAMLLLEERRYQEALDITRAMTANLPDNPLIQNYMGAAMLGLGDVVGARKRFEAALALDPNFKPANINLAEIDLREGRVDAARQRHLDLLKEDPLATSSMVALSRISEEQGDMNDAIQWLEKARNTDVSLLPPQLHLVEIYLNRGEAARALELATDIRERNTESQPILEALGMAQLEAGKREDALTTLHRLADLGRDNPAYLLRAAQLQLRAGDQAGAHTSLSRCVTAFPDFMPAQVAMVRLELQMARGDVAMSRVREMRKERGDQPIIDMLWGDVLMPAGRYAEAAQAYGRVLDSAPSSYVVTRFITAHRKAGTKPLPLAPLQTWIAAHPEDRTARMTLAGTLAWSGDRPGAIAQFETLLKEDQNNPVILNNLAHLYEEDGQQARADELAQRAYATGATIPAVADTYATLLLRQGKATQALNVLRDAVARDSRNVWVRLHMAQALLELGRTDNARTELAAARKLAPLEPDAAALADRLEEKAGK